MFLPLTQHTHAARVQLVAGRPEVPEVQQQSIRPATPPSFFRRRGPERMRGERFFLVRRYVELSSLVDDLRTKGPGGAAEARLKPKLKVGSV